jgi:succinate-acetate transporter protein
MLETEKVRGISLISIALIGFSIYTFILFGTDFGIMLMKLTVLIIVGIIFFIIGWIGATLTIDKEKNIKN